MYVELAKRVGVEPAGARRRASGRVRRRGSKGGADPETRNRPTGRRSESRPGAWPCGVTSVTVDPESWRRRAASSAATRPHQWNGPSIGSKWPRRRTCDLDVARRAPGRRTTPAGSWACGRGHRRPLSATSRSRPLAVDADAVLAGDALEGVPDERAEVARDRGPAHRLATQPPLAGGQAEADQAVGPRLGAGGVEPEVAQRVAQGAGDRRPRPSPCRRRAGRRWWGARRAGRTRAGAAAISRGRPRSPARRARGSGRRRAARGAARRSPAAAPQAPTAR